MSDWQKIYFLVCPRILVISLCVPGDEKVWKLLPQVIPLGHSFEVVFCFVCIYCHFIFHSFDLFLKQDPVTFHIIMAWWWWTPLVFFLSGELFICPWVLNGSFAGQSNLDCRSLLFMTLNISCQFFLACIVSFEKSADSLMGTPL